MVTAFQNYSIVSTLLAAHPMWRRNVLSLHTLPCCSTISIRNVLAMAGQKYEDSSGRPPPKLMSFTRYPALLPDYPDQPSSPTRGEQQNRKFMASTRVSAKISSRSTQPHIFNHTWAAPRGHLRCPENVIAALQSRRLCSPLSIHFSVPCITLTNHFAMGVSQDQALGCVREVTLWLAQAEL